MQSSSQNAELNKTLQSCGTKKIGEVLDVPMFRLCPKCKTLIFHQDRCKHITCLSCKQAFCFICLSLYEENKWKCGGPSDKCPIAARQQV